MLQTKFTELLGCTVPLQQAGMGKIASPALAAAVADAGGLGMVSGIGAAPPEYVAKSLDELPRAAALAAGASAVRVGTRFVAAEEAGTHPVYVDKLIAAEAKDTILTEAFSANWPNAPHRVLRSCVEAVERFQGEFVGETVQPWAPGVRVPVQTRASFVADKTTTGEFDAMPLWAGESVDGVKRIQKAGEIVRELADEAEKHLRNWGDLNDPGRIT